MQQKMPLKIQLKWAKDDQKSMKQKVRKKTTVL